MKTRYQRRPGQAEQSPKCWLMDQRGGKLLKIPKLNG